MKLEDAKTKKKLIAIQDKRRVPDPWNYFTLKTLSNRCSDECRELESVIEDLPIDDIPNVPVHMTVNTTLIKKQMDAVIDELADVANFVDYIEKRLIKLGWLE